MVQLIFNDEFNNVIEEPINYWKTMDDVPKHIKTFILTTSSSRVINDTNTQQYYCSKCLRILDNSYYCSNCSNQCIIPLSNYSKYVIKTDIKNIKNYEESNHYYVFDIVSGRVLIYIFCVFSDYHNSLISIPYQKNRITIEKVYHITNIGITNLITNVFSSFNEYDKSMDSDDFDFDLFEVFETLNDNHFLYTNNLVSLQSIPIYQYTNIWKLKDYYEQNNFTLSSLTYRPIHFKQFEYLVKMKLYQLACNSSHLIEYKHSFKDTFGVDKKYYNFMKKIDINLNQLKALAIYPNTDLELINFMSKAPYIFKELTKYVTADKIKIYLENQGLNYNNIYEYYDYIRCCEYMSLDMKSKQVLFPKHFIEQHDKITNEIIIAKNSKINNRIHTLSKIFLLNKYEDDNYIIFPADSIESLIDESSQQSNCVRTYCDRVSNNECQIYFMRKKNNINKSLLTIEVRNGKIVQAKAKMNEEPSNELKDILERWEQQIVPITNL